MPVETAAAIVAISVVVVAVAVVVAVVVLVRLSADVRELLADIRPRLDRLDRLADDAEETMSSLRDSLRTTGEVVRAPLAAVAQVGRVIREFGEELGDQADRVRGKPRWRRAGVKSDQETSG
jgi:hypothetical protein